MLLVRVTNAPTDFRELIGMKFTLDKIMMEFKSRDVANGESLFLEVEVHRWFLVGTLNFTQAMLT